MERIERGGSDSGEPVQFKHGAQDIETERSIAEQEDHSGRMVKIMSSLETFIIGRDSAKDADNLPSFAIK
jgi:hypothetical protein